MHGNNEEEQINSMNRNKENQHINKMINGLPMFRCTAQEGIIKSKFFISVFEKILRDKSTNKPAHIYF